MEALQFRLSRTTQTIINFLFGLCFNDSNKIEDDETLAVVTLREYKEQQLLRSFVFVFVNFVQSFILEAVNHLFWKQVKHAGHCTPFEVYKLMRSETISNIFIQDFSFSFKSSMIICASF